MAELADARGLGPRGATRGGSTPLPPIVLFDRAEEELKRACKLGIQVDATLRERRLTVEQANGRPGASTAVRRRRTDCEAEGAESLLPLRFVFFD